MINRSLLFPILASLALSACGSTFEGLKQDWNNLSTSTSQKFNELKEKQDISSQQIQADGSCPEIIIDPQLDSLKEFEDMQNPSENNLVSHAALKAVTGNCKISDDNEYLEMRLDLALISTLGPKAKRVESDRPFFAYPYFISVTDNQGQELAKEIFAASVTYEVDQKKVELLETINQRLPLNDDGSRPDYQIHVGFQLTDEQLFYNASK